METQIFIDKDYGYIGFLEGGQAVHQIKFKYNIDKGRIVIDEYEEWKWTDLNDISFKATSKIRKENHTLMTIGRSFVYITTTEILPDSGEEEYQTYIAFRKDGIIGDINIKDYYSLGKEELQKIIDNFVNNPLPEDVSKVIFEKFHVIHKAPYEISVKFYLDDNASKYTFDFIDSLVKKHGRLDGFSVQFKNDDYKEWTSIGVILKSSSAELSFRDISKRLGINIIDSLKYERDIYYGNKLKAETGKLPIEIARGMIMSARKVNDFADLMIVLNETVSHPIHEIFRMQKDKFMKKLKSSALNRDMTESLFRTKFMNAINSFQFLSAISTFFDTEC